MGGEAQHPAEGALRRIAGLEGEPFVDHQGLVLPAFVEGGQGLVERLAAQQHQGVEAAHGVGHVGGGLEVALGALAIFRMGSAARSSSAALRRARRPAASAIGGELARLLQAAVQPAQGVAEMDGHARAQTLARVMDRRRIGRPRRPWPDRVPRAGPAAGP